MVCNAGLSLHEGDFRHVTPDKFDAQFNTNFRGAYFLAQTFLEHLEEHKRQGDLLFISSETADHAVDIPYGLTKSAVNCLVGGGFPENCMQKGFGSMPLLLVLLQRR